MLTNHMSSLRTYLSPEALENANNKRSGTFSNNKIQNDLFVRILKTTCKQFYNLLHH